MTIGTCNGTAGVSPGWPTGRTHPAVPFRTGIAGPRFYWAQVLLGPGFVRPRFYWVQPTAATSPAASTAGAAATGAAEAAEAAAPCMAWVIPGMTTPFNRSIA